jgi:adenylate kinase
MSHLGGELRLLLIAAPGGGKGTQGELLSARLGIEHISSGDLLRAETRADTSLGREIAAYQQRGDLVPDQVVFDVLIPVVVAAAARGGYILDGFPRTVQQATAAAEIGVRYDVVLDAAVYMHVPEPVLVQRLLARARADDTIEIIRHRLQVFSETTGPLIAYYQTRGILIEVDADKPPEAIATEIESRLPPVG